jgi:hypothetical protein
MSRFRSKNVAERVRNAQASGGGRVPALIRTREEPTREQAPRHDPSMPIRMSWAGASSSSPWRP